MDGAVLARGEENVLRDWITLDFTSICLVMNLNHYHFTKYIYSINRFANFGNVAVLRNWLEICLGFGGHFVES